MFERKLARGELRSAKARERWADTQDLHLIPYFGDWYLDAIRKPDIEAWKAAQGRKIERKEYSPNTANSWLSILLTTLRAAVEDLELGRDPTRKVSLLAKAAGIKQHLTARFMRRTFQALGRQTKVHDFVVRAISGHATVAMQERYSSVAGDEVRAGLAKVISLAGFTRFRGERNPESG